MKIGYRAGFRDGKADGLDEGYQRGWEEAQVHLCGTFRQQGFRNALEIVREMLLKAEDARGVAGVILEIEEVLSR